MKKFAPALLISGVIWLLPTLSLADQKDERLGSLFDRLLNTSDSAEGQRITREIWIHWRRTEDDTAHSFMGKGIRDMANERYDEAMVAFNKVIEVLPDYAEGWNKRATLHYLMGDYKASVTDIARTLKLEPRHFGAISGLGLIYFEVGKYSDAQLAFERALAINPHMAGAKRNIELIMRRLGKMTL
jgi:tetratricopeptide (TPR) repeat protein